MGLKIFINNIRYLFRYNIKKINQQTENSIKSENMYEIISNLPYIKIDDSKIRKPKIIGVEETIDKLITTKKSMARFGDGEFTIISGGGIPFQKNDNKLAKRLAEILQNKNKNIYVGISSIYYNIELEKYNKLVYEFLYKSTTRMRNDIKDRIDYQNKYISAEITQLYQIYKDYDFLSYFEKIKKIWDNEEIVIVCGKSIFDKIDYNIFENAKNIIYEYAQSKDAYDEYENILEGCKKYPQDKLFIIILGPTATVLAYDLSELGYRALDFGHIAKDYDYYMKNIERDKKSINDFFKPD